MKTKKKNRMMIHYNRFNAFFTQLHHMTLTVIFNVLISGIIHLALIWGMVILGSSRKILP